MATISVMPTTQPDFDALIRAALDEPVAGWAFPFLEGRRTSYELAWNYREIARGLVRDANVVLDHGTGGGEVLAGLGRPHDHVIATEAYAPNVPIARRALEPLGVDVIEVSEETFDTRGPSAEHPDRRMPFDDASFDLVLARNVAFSSTEMIRILRPGGHLLTEMGRVGAPRPGEVRLAEHFPDVTTNDWPAWSLTDHLTAAGFVIEDYREQLARTHFRDIGALVYFLRTVPWAIPDFTVETYRDRLRTMHDHIHAHGSIVTAGTSILAHATKPA
jgi:SAM-dependent methyltransferase